MKREIAPDRDIARGIARHIGLARAISKLGYCSRARAAELIRQGKVKLNGRTVRDPQAPIREGKTRIELEGELLEAAEKIYWMMNKPRGYVTTASDERGRRPVYDLLPRERPWIAPVGRLDQASEGLLLFTNDSEWAARITEPERHVRKTYHAQVGGHPAPDALQDMARGVRTRTGEVMGVQKVRVLRSGGRNCWLEIILDEGRNRQIRSVLQALNIEVLRLVRVAVGELQLGDLAKGSVRSLTREELRRFASAIQHRRSG